MTEDPEEGLPSDGPDQTSSPATESCGVDPPPNKGELPNEDSRNLPALAPQHNIPDERELSPEKIELFTAPTGEVSVVCNLDGIETYAATNAAAAAIQCGKAAAKLVRGQQLAIRTVLSTVFFITYRIYHNNRQLELFNLYYCSHGPTKKNESVEDTRDKLTYRVCEYIYYFFGNATKNNAYIYGYALDYYLKSGMDPSEVRKLIIKHGPEKLYRAELERKKLEKIKVSYEQSGRKIDEPIDQSYLLQVATETDEGEKAKPFEPSLNEHAQKEQAHAPRELTMNHDDAAPSEDDLDSDDLLENNDDQENEDNAEDGDDEGFWDALMSIDRKLSRLTSIVLRLETGLNNLANTLQAK